MRCVPGGSTPNKAEFFFLIRSTSTYRKCARHPIGAIEIGSRRRREQQLAPGPVDKSLVSNMLTRLARRMPGTHRVRLLTRGYRPITDHRSPISLIPGAAGAAWIAGAWHARSRAQSEARHHLVRL